jgi:hypothetical protein
MVYIIISAVWAALFVWAIISFIRLNQFGRFMDREIDRVFEARVRAGYVARVSGNLEPWPDVKACYDNLKWYNPFDFNFKRMMVYDYSR